MSLLNKKRADYHKYLKSDTWKRKARACRKRAGYRCQLCATTNQQLETHHNTYENLGDEKPIDLVCLCDLCHEMFHKHRKIGD